MSDYTLDKKYKLCSKKLFSEVIEKGDVIRKHPFTCRVTTTDKLTHVPFQVAISVPKRLFKKAVDRNRIKRQIREGIRLNKGPLETCDIDSDKQLILLIVYTHQKEESTDFIIKQIKKLVEQVQKHNFTLAT